MPFFLVPIILGVSAVAAAGVGIKKGVDGFSNMKSAKEIGERAQQKYNEALVFLENERQTVNNDAENLFDIKVSIRNSTLLLRSITGIIIRCIKHFHTVSAFNGFILNFFCAKRAPLHYNYTTCSKIALTMERIAHS